MPQPNKHTPIMTFSAALFAAFLLSGCAVYTVVDTAVSVTATAVETTADVAGGAVSAVAGGDDDEDDD